MKLLALLLLMSCEPDHPTMERMCIGGVSYYFYNRMSITPMITKGGKYMYCDKPSVGAK